MKLLLDIYWISLMPVLWAGPVAEVVFWDLKYTPSGWDRSHVPTGWKWFSGCVYLGALSSLVCLPWFL